MSFNWLVPLGIDMRFGNGQHPTTAFFERGESIWQGALLLQKGHRNPLPHNNFTLIGHNQARHNFEERRLSTAVSANQSDPIAFVDRD